MTKNKTTFVWAEPIPGFDVVEWKRKVHAEIRQETAGMTKEEIREYFRKGSKEFQKEAALYRAKHGTK
jgi:hypothetical protein